MRTSLPVRFGSLAVRPPLVAAGQRIGLMGGSFNPPHAGHRAIALVALKKLGLDQVWWLVTPGNPLKGGSDLAPLAERMAQARATADDRRIVVTAFETDLPSAYTVVTLAHLRLRHGDVGFVWIMGADCLAQFHRWQQWREIFQSMPIAVVDRPGWRLKALASPAAQAFSGRRIGEQEARLLVRQPPPAWCLLTGPLLAISSTAIRSKRKRPTGSATG